MLGSRPCVELGIAGPGGALIAAVAVVDIPIVVRCILPDNPETIVDSSGCYCRIPLLDTANVGTAHQNVGGRPVDAVLAGGGVDVWGVIKNALVCPGGNEKRARGGGCVCDQGRDIGIELALIRCVVDLAVESPYMVKLD